MNYRPWNNSLWHEQRDLNTPLGLLADDTVESPTVQSMLVVQPDRSRRNLGWFVYAPMPPRSKITDQ